MAHKYILSVDVGTSSTKSALWDEDGNIVSNSTISNVLIRPNNLSAEVDGMAWWNVVCQSIKNAVRKSQINPKSVAGIGVDGVGLSLVPVDENVKPLAPVMIWLDRRAKDETKWLNNLPDAKSLINLVANPIDESYITPKIIWFRKHFPEIFKATHKILGSTGFIVAKLTGEFTCDYTQANGYHFYDIRNKKWDTSIADKIGIPIEKLPRLCSPTELVGELTNQAALETGLVPGIPIIAGCLDAAVGALGAGVTRQGQTNEQGGQAGGFGISTNQVIVEPRLVLSHHALEGQYLLSASTVGGGSLNWFRNQIDQTEFTHLEQSNQSTFESYNTLASKSSPGSNGLIFLPYLSGERTPLWSNIPTGVFFGLTYNTSRSDILRSIMEGCAFAVYDNLLIAEEKEVFVSEFFGSGGATKSDIWCQIKADIYNRPFIVTKRRDGGNGGHALGLFSLTAYAIGIRDNIESCINELLPNKKIFHPSYENHAIYEELFQIFRSLSRKLMDEFVMMDKFKRN